MPGFPIIDVAIGIIFIYLTLSLVITATNEFISSVLARRQKTLLLGIRNLLGDNLADKLYDHPLIRSLRNDGKRPSYIPSRSFALALLDLIEPRIASTTPPQTSDPRPAMLQARLDGGTTGQEAQPANAGQAVTPITLPES